MVNRPSASKGRSASAAERRVTRAEAKKRGASNVSFDEEPKHKKAAGNTPKSGSKKTPKTPASAKPTSAEKGKNPVTIQPSRV
eukprot:gene25673-biopygen10758